MSRFLLPVEEEELGDNVADMIACSTDENSWWTPSLNVMPTWSETLQRFNESLQRCIIYLLSYEVLQQFIEALSNLMCCRTIWVSRYQNVSILDFIGAKDEGGCGNEFTVTQPTVSFYYLQFT